MVVKEIRQLVKNPEFKDPYGLDLDDILETIKVLTAFGLTILLASIFGILGMFILDALSLSVLFCCVIVFILYRLRYRFRVLSKMIFKQIIFCTKYLWLFILCICCYVFFALFQLCLPLLFSRASGNWNSNMNQGDSG